MDDIVVSPPPSNEDDRSFLGLVVSLFIPALAGLLGYFFLRHMTIAEYGNLPAFLVLGCFIFFAVVFVALNNAIGRIDEKADTMLVQMDRAVAESEHLEKIAEEIASRIEMEPKNN
ncbi:MAG: hypothetical protein R3229_15185 [Alphaproteobacteria bacterium]|nr:hypothetical protein [Alphaproteobacteria bacterium]